MSGDDGDDDSNLQPSVEATEDWVVSRCGVDGDITAWKQLALPGYTTQFPKIHSLGTSLISFAGLTSLDVSRNCLTSFEGLSSLSQLQRLNFYFNQVATLSDLARLRANRALSHLDCRLNPMARNHPNFRLHALHTLPQLQRLDERDVRPAERRQALAYVPAEAGGSGGHKAPGAASERSSWSSAGGDGGREHDSASLQRAARALLQQDDDEDDEEDEYSSAESDRGRRHGAEWEHEPSRRRGDGGRRGGSGSRHGRQSTDYPMPTPTSPSNALHGLQPPHGALGRGGDDSSADGRHSSQGFDQAPQAVAAALAKCESEQRRRQAAEAELDELRSHMRSATQETARLRRELADATSTAAAESAERQSEGAETVRWRQRAEAAEKRLANAEDDAASKLVKHEATVLEIERLQQQLATSQQLHGTMVEERTELMAQVESAKALAQTAATSAAEREKKVVAESRSLRNEISVAERYLEEARHRIELLSTELSNAKEHAAREASRYEQTTELTQMLREAHASLAASNDSLRKECDALHNRYNMDADQWKRNFNELKKQQESYGDLGKMTASVLQAGLPSALGDEPLHANVAAAKGYYSDGDVALGERGAVGSYGTSEGFRPPPRSPARGGASGGPV